jgi:hypothetical protein
VPRGGSAPCSPFPASREKGRGDRG